MDGFKAFNKDMTCQGFKYKEGETYKTDRAVCCSNGFHFCENPLDVLSYYDLCESEFHKVEALGKLDKDGGDSKHATTEIKIGAKLSLSAFIEASVDFVLKTCKPKKDSKNNNKNSAQQASSGYYAKQASSGDYAQQASSGYYAQQASSGDYAQQASSGDYAQSEINGKYSVSASIGKNSKIKGKKGNWITLAEWKYDDKLNCCIPVCVKSAQITGRKLKEDTWYKLENDEFVEVK